MEDIHKKIKISGGRLTKVKKAIVSILFENQCLLSKIDITERLYKRKITPNRSTIYRELQYLIKHNIILKNTISGVDYLEIPQDHHHHLVCVKCNAIKKIDIGRHLKNQEKQIRQQNKFNITKHSLEFYGYCRECHA